MCSTSPRLPQVAADWASARSTSFDDISPQVPSAAPPAAPARSSCLLEILLSMFPPVTAWRGGAPVGRPRLDGSDFVDDPGAGQSKSARFRLPGGGPPTRPPPGRVCGQIHATRFSVEVGHYPPALPAPCLILHTRLA